MPLRNQCASNWRRRNSRGHRTDCRSCPRRASCSRQRRISSRSRPSSSGAKTASNSESVWLRMAENSGSTIRRFQRSPRLDYLRITPADAPTGRYRPRQIDRGARRGSGVNGRPQRGGCRNAERDVEPVRLQAVSNSKPTMLRSSRPNSMPISRIGTPRCRYLSA